MWRCGIELVVLYFIRIIGVGVNVMKRAQKLLRNKEVSLSILEAEFNASTRYSRSWRPKHVEYFYNLRQQNNVTPLYIYLIYFLCLCEKANLSYLTTEVLFFFALDPEVPVHYSGVIFMDGFRFSSKKSKAALDNRFGHLQFGKKR